MFTLLFCWDLVVVSGAFFSKSGPQGQKIFRPL